MTENRGDLRLRFLVFSGEQAQSMKNCAGAIAPFLSDYLTAKDRVNHFVKCDVSPLHLFL